MKKLKFPLIFVAGAMIGILSTQNLATVRELLSGRVAEVLAGIKYAISPPQEVVFVPQGVADPTTGRESGTLTESSVNGIVATAVPTFTPSLSQPGPLSTPISIPQAINLTGFVHEYQTWNNCGPATLSMALSFWGWKGNQQPIAAFTKPNARDKNVMPYEMVAFVEEKAQLQAIARVGGEIALLKRLLAAGFPVIVEKGFELPGEGWIGHYQLVTGYDDSNLLFTLQDSYLGPDQVMTYDDLFTIGGPLTSPTSWSSPMNTGRRSSPFWVGTSTRNTAFVRLLRQQHAKSIRWQDGTNSLPGSIAAPA